MRSWVKTFLEVTKWQTVSTHAELSLPHKTINAEARGSRGQSAQPAGLKLSNRRAA